MEILHQFEPWSTHLDGKIVMVTGASAGPGLDFCLDLARAGCRVVVAAVRRTDLLKSLCDQISIAMEAPDGSGSCQAIAVELDVAADSSTIEANVERAWAAFGSIDALINNAGLRGQVKSSLELSEEEWDRVVKTNLRGSWLVWKYVGERMRRRGACGSVINISSIAGLNGFTVSGGIAYTASKTGLNSMTKIMALELGEYCIRLNSSAPALFKSEITEELLRKQMFQKFGTTDHALTSLIRYLIHYSSNYVTGNIFIADSLLGSPLFSSL
ncbi:LOW QUALITY PROTEIN: uncharacterized protein LOC130990222 [Salvia miltiorrhiza]|uniref:LOW QUALITY PROTEIN: uncharacterized protein LOC130990222 n=1 Tax=Salvia miltiorrhiza TaxID=226208 RepID=UPI0025AD4CB3|nr:LOW QUALITY PROTEIN: uncharacterized protein LOC130990222 [Salvia miltiorrhiza]